MSGQKEDIFRKRNIKTFSFHTHMIWKLVQDVHFQKRELVHPIRNELEMLSFYILIFLQGEKVGHSLLCQNVGHLRMGFKQEGFILKCFNYTGIRKRVQHMTQVEGISRMVVKGVPGRGLHQDCGSESPEVDRLSSLHCWPSTLFLIS